MTEGAHNEVLPLGAHANNGARRRTNKHNPFLCQFLCERCIFAQESITKLKPRLSHKVQDLIKEAYPGWTA